MATFDLTFKGSPHYSVGIELELLLVDKDSLLPTHQSHLIFEQVNLDFKPYIHPEFFSSMIEISSPIFNYIDEIEPYFNKAIAHLYQIVGPHNILFFANGIHPLLRYQDAVITNKDRYQEIQAELRGVVDRFIIQGLHVHAGLPNAETVVRASNLVSLYLPILLSLSTSSPFYEGDDTGLHSYRSKIFESLPRSGIPEYFEDYDDFLGLVKVLNEGQAIEAFNKLWWDVRIRPDFSTLELRICDAVNDVHRIESIAVLFQAICKWSETQPARRVYHEVSKENKWNAVRYGMEGKYIGEGGLTTIRGAALDLVQALQAAGIFSAMKTTRYVKQLIDYINQPSLSAQLVALYQETGSLDAVLRGGIMERP